jgi:hypothetical protein
MKMFHSCGFLLMVALLSACGSKAPKTVQAECAFPDNPREAAPLWVCDAPVEGVAVSAVGSYEKSAAGYAFMKDQATADGRVKLAQQFRVQVQNMVKQYVGTTGSGKSETVDRVNSSVSKQITNESLAGSKVFRSANSSNGFVYVLVGLDPSMAKMAGEQALQTSMRNERAIWQQIQGRKADSELAAEIYKMGNQGN